MPCKQCRFSVRCNATLMHFFECNASVKKHAKLNFHFQQNLWLLLVKIESFQEYKQDSEINMHKEKKSVLQKGLLFSTKGRGKDWKIQAQSKLSILFSCFKEKWENEKLN